VSQAAPPGADMPRFIRDLMAFVALDEADVAAIRGTAPLVLAHGSEITAALYDHLLAFPATARFFLGDDGAPDLARLERRKHTLARWLRETAEVATTQEFAYYALAVGLSHSHHRPERGGPVPAQFMIGAISLVQTALARLFGGALDDPRQALAASQAWNKLVLVQLTVLLLGYLPPSRP
jgi:hypothetical protein